VKAQAFSYKLVISNDIKEKSSLKKLLVLVKENKYQEALSFAKEIKKVLIERSIVFYGKLRNEQDYS
jgi:hypothetical protein